MADYSPSVRGQRLAQTADASGGQHATAVVRSLALVKRILRSKLAKKGPKQAFGLRLGQILEQSSDNLSLLPLLTCNAVGGDFHRAIPLMAAWRLLRLSAKLLDDVADGESLYPPAEAVGLATGLLFLAPLALGELQSRGVSASRIECLTRSLHEAGLRACAGQYAEFSPFNNVNPDDWLGIAHTKSGDPCAWAAWAGALIAGAGERVLADFHNYGLHLGILLQVADDFNGIWHSPDFSDLRSGQLNLAVCYARLVAEGEQKDHLEALLKNAGEGDHIAESEMRQILIRLGSQAYLLVVGSDQRQQALVALQRRNVPYPPLVNLLDQMWPILAKMGEEERTAY